MDRMDGWSYYTACKQSVFPHLVYLGAEAEVSKQVCRSCSSSFIRICME